MLAPEFVTEGKKEGEGKRGGGGKKEGKKRKEHRAKGNNPDSAAQAHRTSPSISCMLMREKKKKKRGGEEKEGEEKGKGSVKKQIAYAEKVLASATWRALEAKKKEKGKKEKIKEKGEMKLQKRHRPRDGPKKHSPLSLISIFVRRGGGEKKEKEEEGERRDRGDGPPSLSPYFSLPCRTL